MRIILIYLKSSVVCDPASHQHMASGTVEMRWLWRKRLRLADSPLLHPLGGHAKGSAVTQMNLLGWSP